MPDTPSTPAPEAPRNDLKYTYRPPLIDKFLRFWKSRRAIRMAVYTAVVYLAVTMIFFGLVAAEKTTTTAFELWTNETSAETARAGPLGVILVILGVFVGTAVIGAIAAAVFAAFVRLPEDAFDRRLEKELGPITTQLKELERRLRERDRQQQPPKEPGKSAESG